MLNKGSLSPYILNQTFLSLNITQSNLKTVITCQSGGSAKRPKLGFSLPARILRAVLLPIPLVPTRPSTSPGRGVGNLSEHFVSNLQPFNINKLNILVQLFFGIFCLLRFCNKQAPIQLILNEVHCCMGVFLLIWQLLLAHVHMTHICSLRSSL